MHGDATSRHMGGRNAGDPGDAAVLAPKGPPPRLTMRNWVGCLTVGVASLTPCAVPVTAACTVLLRSQTATLYERPQPHPCVWKKTSGIRGVAHPLNSSEKSRWRHLQGSRYSHLVGRCCLASLKRLPISLSCESSNTSLQDTGTQQHSNRHGDAATPTGVCLTATHQAAQYSNTASDLLPCSAEAATRMRALTLTATLPSYLAAAQTTPNHRQVV